MQPARAYKVITKVVAMLKPSSLALAIVATGGLVLAAQSSALAAPDKPAPTPPKKAPEKPPEKPPAPALACKLLTKEAPRGGRVEVQGHGFGRTPLVRIADRVVRILERSGDKIAAQIPRDSSGGPVSVQAGEHRAQCGTLTIIGTD